nr:hypothetical protein GCM10025699_08420 [Microbacterium flavescens]
MNLLFGAIFVFEFLVALVRGSLIVAAQVLDFRRRRARRSSPFRS